METAGVLQLAVSPDGQNVAALFTLGDVVVCSLPALRFQHRWSAADLQLEVFLFFFLSIARLTFKVGTQSPSSLLVGQQ